MERGFLIVVRGASRGAHAPLDAGDVVIGRGRDCGLRLAEPQCSRRHARVIPTPGGVRVEDLGATNGTYLNDVLLTAGRPLVLRDRIRIGATVIEFQAGSGSEPTAASGGPRAARPPEAPSGGGAAMPARLTDIPGRRPPDSALRALVPSDGARTRAYVVTIGLLAVVAALVAWYVLTR